MGLPPSLPTPTSRWGRGHAATPTGRPPGWRTAPSGDAGGAVERVAQAFGMRLAFASPMTMRTMSSVSLEKSVRRSGLTDLP